MYTCVRTSRSTLSPSGFLAAWFRLRRVRGIGRSSTDSYLLSTGAFQAGVSHNESCGFSGLRYRLSRACLVSSSLFLAGLVLSLSCWAGRGIFNIERAGLREVAGCEMYCFPCFLSFPPLPSNPAAHLHHTPTLET